MEPIVCPLCLRNMLENLASDVKLIVDGELRRPEGLLSYRCTEYGHVFFVRESDVEREVSTS